MFEKLILSLQHQLKSDSKLWKIIATVGLAIAALLLLLKYKIMQDEVNKAKVIKSVANEKHKDLELSKDLEKINARELQIDKTIVESDKALKSIQEDLQHDIKEHQKSVKTIESLGSWQDVDKVVKNK